MMYCYFSSAYPAAVKLNGAYFGRTDGDARGVNIEETSVFVEICPLKGGSPFGFLLDGEFLKNPPPFASVADLKGGYLIRFYDSPKSAEFKIVAQEKFPSAVITVFNDGGLKASIETPFGFKGETFSFFSEDADIRLLNISGKDTAIIFFGQEKAAYLFDVSKNPEKLGSFTVDSFTSENGYLHTVYNKTDMAKHKIESRWEIKDGKISETERKVSASETFDKTAIPDILIPYAFFEELSVGGDYEFYLSESVKENADKLKSYFGNFLSIMPPPPFRNHNEIGLVYKAGENRYSVDYATTAIENGKIVNLKRSDI